MNKKRHFFDPETSFLDLWIVRITIVVLLAISIGLGVFIGKSSNLAYKYDYTGFNNLLEIYKVPLGLLALIIPVVALLAANHRSEQTKKQIEVTNSQNCFSNYYKHLEEFEKYYKLSESKFPYLKEYDSRHIHSLMFPDSMKGIYTLSSTFEDLFKIIYIYIYQLQDYKENSEILHVKSINDDLLENLEDKGIDINLDTELLRRLTGLLNKTQETIEIFDGNSEDDRKVNTQIVNANIVSSYISIFAFLVSSFTALCRFDTTFKPERWTRVLLSTKTRPYVEPNLLSNETRHKMSLKPFGSIDNFLNAVDSDLKLILHSEECNDSL